jgi:hypothetical protein
MTTALRECDSSRGIQVWPVKGTTVTETFDSHTRYGLVPMLEPCVELRLWRLQISCANKRVKPIGLPKAFTIRAESRWILMTTRICEPEEDMEGLPVVSHPFSEAWVDKRPRFVFFYSLCVQRSCGYVRQATMERVFSASILCPRCRSILISLCSRCGKLF